jgi:hypothetical protein
LGGEAFGKGIDHEEEQRRFRWDDWGSWVWQGRRRWWRILA